MAAAGGMECSWAGPRWELACATPLPTTAWPHLNAYGARTSARLCQPLTAGQVLCTIFIFISLRALRLRSSLNRVYVSVSAVVFVARRCLVELAFYICFNFLAIS